MKNECVHCIIVYEKLLINGSCLTLVLTTVMGRPRHTDPKKDVYSKIHKFPAYLFSIFCLTVT
jgi:hypothetical protein